jgi:protein SCO1/2
MMRALFVISMILTLGFGRDAHCQRTESLESLAGVGIDEKLNQQLPLQLQFRDSAGKTLRLADLFDGKQPVILSLNYSDCPMLCQLQLNGLVDGLRDLAWNPGEDFRIVSLSIDPLETAARARQTKQRYVKAYGRLKTAAGWHFLTGDKDSIRQLADAVGFRFKYVAERKEYAHAAAIIVATPTGRTSRYLYGVLYPPQTLKLSLVEAGEGKIGSTLDRVLLFCFHYDAVSGRYAPVARQILKVAAGITLATVLVGLIPSWLRRRRDGEHHEDAAREVAAGGGVV